MVAGVVKLLIRKVRLLFSPVVRAIRRALMKRQLVGRLANSNDGYVFLARDIDLYAGELFANLPRMRIDTFPSDQKFVCVVIKEISIYWPVALPSKDLPWLFHEVFDEFETNPSSYDHPSMDFKSRQWIMDAGAAEGYFSVFALLRSHARMIVVEPLALMRPALDRTMRLYDSGERAVIVSAALSDKSGWSEIQVDSDHICDSSISSNLSSEGAPKSSSGAECVEVTTIDHMAKKHGLGFGGMIKMDIEGFEMAALVGATVLMRAHKPALAIAVYHGVENARKCAEIIKNANPSYEIEFRGCYGYFDPPRPYMVFAY